MADSNYEICKRGAREWQIVYKLNQVWRNAIIERMLLWLEFFFFLCRKPFLSPDSLTRASLKRFNPKLLHSPDIIDFLRSHIIRVKSCSAHLTGSIGYVNFADGGKVSNSSRKCSAHLCTQTDLSDCERRGVSATTGDSLCLWWAPWQALYCVIAGLDRPWTKYEDSKSIVKRGVDSANRANEKQSHGTTIQ